MPAKSSTMPSCRRSKRQGRAFRTRKCQNYQARKTTRTGRRRGEKRAKVRLVPFRRQSITFDPRGGSCENSRYFLVCTAYAQQSHWWGEPADSTKCSNLAIFTTISYIWVVCLRLRVIGLVFCAGQVNVQETWVVAVLGSIHFYSLGGFDRSEDGKNVSQHSMGEYMAI